MHTRAGAARLDQSARRVIGGSYGPVRRSLTRPGVLGLKGGTQRVRIDLGARAPGGTWPRHAAAARSLNVAATGLIRFSASSMLTCLVLVTTSFKVALIAAAFCR